MLDDEEVCFDDALESIDDGSFRLTVASVENPNQLAEHQNRNEKRLFLLTATFDEPLGSARLPRIVRSQIPDQDVSVEASHRLAKPSAMAWFICSTDTGFRRFGRKMPFNSRTSRFRGRTTTSPSGAIWNSRRWRPGV